MRQMFVLIEQYTNSLIKTLSDDLKDPQKGEFEMKELFSSFTVDIIATSVFGLEIDSYKNPENDFKKVANATMKPNTFFIIIKMILLNIFPKIMKKLDISILDQHTKNFFRQTISETMKYREEKNIFRPDMINLLMQAKKGKLSEDDIEHFHWTDDEIVAQCLVFFLAGFDTTSSTLSFAAHELAVNPDIQEKLRSEISSMDQKLNGKSISYDDLKSLKYLDRFIMEVLRKWTPGVAMERVCVKDFSFELEGKTITIPEKHSVIFTTYAFHHDPQNFPNPDKFDPDRFDEENINQQNMNAYVPFGMGPRSCIGNRFALMSLKLVIYKMLLNLKFDVTEKTQIPLQYKKTMVNIVTENGTWIKLKPLN